MQDISKYGVASSSGITMKRPLDGSSNGNNGLANKRSFSLASAGTSTISIQKARQSLPVYNSRSRIIHALRDSSTVIIIGETACGKTTQVPQFILESGIAKGRQVAITQPRRVAAITVAERVAIERDSMIGNVVGYAVRFEDVTSTQTKLKFVTDGLLLREAMLDPLLLNYNVIVLDEAHERTIATDVLFGVVKSAQQKRAQKSNPLKIIIMSATMDVDTIRKYFSSENKMSTIPVVWVEGKTHNVEVRHTVKSQDDYLIATLTTLFMIHRESPINEGILVFLTGQEEIDAMAATIPKIAREEGKQQIAVFPLYSALPQDQQALAFKPAVPGIRKVVLATNIAETSVTISGIRHVIDSGMVKARTHLPGTGLDVLKVQRISQAQAWQRTGRAGREAPGICYRCYTKQEFNAMSVNSEPEILRVNLTTVILQLLTIGISRIIEFDFIDKPRKESLLDAEKQLKDLNAIVSSPTNIHELSLTEVGKKMSVFPIDARLAKVLISSDQFECRDEILSLVALLSGEGIMFSSSNNKNDALIKHEKFKSENGDHETYLNIYKAFCASKQKKIFCTENYLNFRALSQATKVREQLEEICDHENLKESSCGSDLSKVRQCLLTGLFLNIATHFRDKTYYTIAKKQIVTLHPSSILFNMNPPPSCILYTELVHTARSYMRQVSVIDPDWISDTYPDIARRIQSSSQSIK